MDAVESIVDLADRLTDSWNDHHLAEFEAYNEPEPAAEE